MCCSSASDSTLIGGDAAETVFLSGYANGDDMTDW